MLLIMAVDSLPTRALAMIVAGCMMGTQEDVDIMALVAVVDVAKIVARGVKEAQLKSTIAPWGTKTVALPGLLADVVEEAMVMDMDHGADFGVEDPRKVAEGEEWAWTWPRSSPWLGRLGVCRVRGRDYYIDSVSGEMSVSMSGPLCNFLACRLLLI
jgi:hypothetical protein